MPETNRPDANRLRDDSRSSAVREEAARKSRRAQLDEVERDEHVPRG